MAMVPHDGSSQSSSHSSEIPRDNYYEKKMSLIIDENARRAEWHALCVDIKKKELEIKEKQAQFWDVAISALNSNPVQSLNSLHVSRFHFRSFS